MTLNQTTIAFIGAGNMAEALIKGLLATHTIGPAQLIATDVRPERLAELAGKYGIRTRAANTAAVASAGIVVLAVKPQQMSDALASIRPALAPAALVISIAAGIPTARLERELGGTVRVVRVMPNTPALVGAGAAALAKGRHATDEDLATTETILRAVGTAVRVDESLLDAVTALSGSGPAYVFLLTEAMIEAGRQVGLPADVARQLAIQTVHGAGQLLVQGGESPEVLRKKVTSPGGTTEATVKVLTDRQWPAIIHEAIAAATQRGRELSGS